MKYNIVVATHHKTGTVWMDGVFKAIASDLGARFVKYTSGGENPGNLHRDPFILFSHDSVFHDFPSLLDREDVKILHLIRDPRDIIISAMHYHKSSREGWLHEPIPGYDNRSYQRALHSLPTKFAQYIFEMDNSSASTLRDMTRWRYGRANCFEARYEDLRQDTQLVIWQRILTFLGFDAAEQVIGNRRFWQNSLFGGLSRLGNRHVRSGAVAQWRQEFTPELAAAFLERFPHTLQSLGYETSDAWALELQAPGIRNALSAFRDLLARHWEVLAGLKRNLNSEGARSLSYSSPPLAEERSMSASTSRWRGPSS